MRSTILIALLAMGSTAAIAADIKVEGAWVRGTTASQKVTGAFMKLTAASKASLVGVSSPVAGKVEVHEMKMIADDMTMRSVPKLALPAGKMVELKPGGYHVMLMDLKQQVKAGDVVPLTLEIEQDGKREKIEIEAVGRPLSDTGTHDSMQH